MKEIVKELRKQELKERINSHQKWLAGEGGERLVLVSEDLRISDFKQLNLTAARFEHCNLERSEFYASRLENVEFVDCNLKFARFNYTLIINSNFSREYAVYTDFSYAKIFNTDFSWAELDGADFRGSVIQDSNCEGASFVDGSFWAATLKNTNFRYANFTCTELRLSDYATSNIPKPALYALKNVKRSFLAYKIVDENFEGIKAGGIKYIPGTIVEEDDYDDDENNLRGKGINLATLDWCLKRFKDSWFEETQPGDKIVEVEVHPRDIVAIPINTNGIFRVKRCKVLRVFLEEEA